MEKQRNHKNIRFVFGLLILLFSAVSSSLYAQISPEQIRRLEIAPVDNQNFSVNEDVKYQLILPGISPLNVYITNPESEDKIIFKTLRRTSDGEDGTRIELWYQFNEAGDFAPEPLQLKIGSKLFQISFVKVRITERFENKRPSAYLKFSNGKTVSRNTSSSILQTTISKAVSFQIVIENVKDIKSIDYEIPKNSLFTKKSDTSFEWTPLKKGRLKVPEFKINVTANNGNNTEIRTPECYITVIDGAQNAGTPSLKADQSFADSFTETITSNLEEETSVSADNFELKIQRRRKTCIKWLFISLGLILLAALSMWMMKIKSPFPYLVLSVLLILAMILFTVLSKKHLAVYTEGTVKSIPELNSGKILQIPENTEVKILKDVGGWYCIQNGTVTGWTLKENVRIY
ncbi:MAG: SH3 domain-containing protein [Treponema sp.]|nr:SH3 domain-containing protein [Treponema sp.]